MSNRFSLHKILNRDQIPFSPMEYSRFKYGDGAVASNFGAELAHSFILTHVELALLPKINLFPSPYQFIPTATYTLAMSFLHELNVFRLGHSLPAAKLSRIYRHTTYTQDYGQMSADMRRQLIGSDLFDFEGVRSEDEFLIMIDDILITGSHEFVVGKALEAGGYLNKHIYLYFAELVNQNIDPSIENELNYASVRSHKDFEHILLSPDFQFNTRNIKYLLGLDLGQFAGLIAQLNEQQLRRLTTLAIGNDYHLKSEFKHNLLNII